MTYIAIALGVAIVVLALIGLVLYNVPLDGAEAGIGAWPIDHLPRSPDPDSPGPGYVEITALGEHPKRYVGPAGEVVGPRPRPRTPDEDALESVVDWAIGYAVGSCYDVTKETTVVVCGELSTRIQDGVRRHLDDVADLIEDDGMHNLAKARARLRVAVERAVIADRALTLEENLDLYLLHPELVDALFFLGQMRDELRESLGGTPA